MAPADESRMWAVLLGLKDDVTAIKSCLMGHMDADGSHREGALAEIDRLRARVIALEDAAGARLTWWKAVALAGVPVLLTWLPTIIKSLTMTAQAAGK